MPCHHRWSQCEQLYILIGSPLTVISMTTSSRERQVGHFIPCDIDRAGAGLEHGVDQLFVNAAIRRSGRRRR